MNEAKTTIEMDSNALKYFTTMNENDIWNKYKSIFIQDLLFKLNDFSDENFKLLLLFKIKSLSEIINSFFPNNSPL